MSAVIVFIRNIIFFAPPVVKFILIFGFILFSSKSYGQNHNTKLVGKIVDFVALYSSADVSRGSDRIILSLPEKDIQGVINRIIHDNGSIQIFGVIENISTSQLYFSIHGDMLEGFIIIPGHLEAYRYFSHPDGNVFVSEIEINEMLRVDLHEEMENQSSTILPQIDPDSVPIRESFPGAEAVVYLDFNGQYVENTPWNGGRPIDAAAPGFSADQILTIWNHVSEDFRPFTVNITTDERVFLAAPFNKRMRCIFTPTDITAPGSGGVAFVNSFNNPYDNDAPCWVFNQGVKTASEAASHEIGHTLGLRHDGRINPHETYYIGQGDWAPIMGCGYSKNIVQWSKGEYSGASNPEDDIAVITKPVNGITLRMDEAGDSIPEASSLVILNGRVDSTTHVAVISSSTDIDVYTFQAGGGILEVRLNLCSDYSNLDASIILTDSSGSVIAFSNPDECGEPYIHIEIFPGRYYIHIDGVGYQDASSSGYSDYSSLGRYSISGTIPAYISYNPAQIRQGVYRIVSRVTGAALNVFEESTSSEAIISTSLYDQLPSQQWQILPTEGGEYTFGAMHSGRFMNVQSSYSGNSFLGYGVWENGENQKWRILENAEGYFAIQSLLNNKVLTSNSSESDPSLWLAEMTGRIHQQWLLEEIEIPTITSSIRKQDIGFTVYPNPTSSIINITTTGEIIKHIALSNIQGDLVYFNDEISNAAKSFDVRRLVPTGIYNLTVETYSKSQVFKLLIE